MILDVKTQSTSLEVWDKKYRLRDNKGYPVDRDESDTRARVAKALASVESTSVSAWEDKFRWAMDNGAIPAGRIMSNAGASQYKPATSLINCTVSSIIKDSVDGISQSLSEAMSTLKAGCGIGYEFSTLRPKGAFVSGAGAYTSGPLTFADVFDKMCFTISSAGGRRGAQMMTFAVWHPDVEEFISAKREDGRLRQFNLSLLIDDDFIAAFNSGGVYELVFPITAKEEGFVGDDVKFVWKKLFWEDEYCNQNGYQVEGDKIKCRVYREVSAGELWETIMKSTYDYAEPGFLMIDEINRKNNNWFCERIRAVNPCQPGFATVLTPDGIRQLKDINIGDTIWSGNVWTKVLDKWSTGVKEVFEYKTTRGRFVGTNNHRVVESGIKTPVSDAKGIDMAIGEVPDCHEGMYCKTYNDAVTIMDGLVIGDGSVHNASNNRVYLCIGKNDGDYFSSEVNICISGKNSIRMPHSYTIDTTIKSEELPKTFERTIPSRFYYADRKTKCLFLRGLYSANGSVVADGTRVTLKSTSKELIYQVSEMLSSLGIPSYVTTNKKRNVNFDNGTYTCKESYDLNITSGRDIFYEDIGFLQGYKNDAILLQSGHIKNRTSKIKGVTSLGKFEVYDITVDCDEHTYWTGGCLVSNCGEQNLPPYGACLLGSINLTAFVEDPLTPDARFNWSKYREVIRIFTRMLDNVVEINGLPLKQQQDELIEKRRHGMGFLGLGSTLTLLGMEYGDSASLGFTEDIMRCMAVEGMLEGVKLAEEKGSAPLLEPLENRKLWLSSGYMERLIGACPDLEEKVLQHGCRFTHHTSIAPTGTISLALANNVSNGIEPTFAHKYTRNIIKEGKNSKEAVEVYSYEMLVYKELTGSDEIPLSFSTTDTVTPKQHVDIQAAAQKWCDSSISKTINVPTDIDFEEFKGIYMYAYEKGLKGCTTFRFNPEAFQGVLVKEEDLANTLYTFELEDGGTHTVPGNQVIVYDGEEHTAANLYDALKEGYYGKF